MRTMLSRVRVPVIAVAAACLLAVCAGWAIAASTTSSATLRACASKSNGVLRLAARCKSSERRVSWNTVGPRGPRGLHGIQGAKGDMGATGATGATGTPGVQGLPGTARAYGRVDPIGGLTRSKNVAAVTHPLGGAGGVYCIQLAPGIDASQTGLDATLDFSGDVTDTGRTQSRRGSNGKAMPPTARRERCGSTPSLGLSPRPVAPTATCGRSTTSSTTRPSSLSCRDATGLGGPTIRRPS